MPRSNHSSSTARRRLPVLEQRCLLVLVAAAACTLLVFVGWGAQAADRKLTRDVATSLRGHGAAGWMLQRLAANQTVAAAPVPAAPAPKAALASEQQPREPGPAPGQEPTVEFAVAGLHLPLAAALDPNLPELPGEAATGLSPGELTIGAGIRTDDKFAAIVREAVASGQRISRLVMDTPVVTDTPSAPASQKPEPAVPAWQGRADGQILLLVAVTSSCCTQLSRERRIMIRRTWGGHTRATHPNVNIKFVLAQPRGGVNTSSEAYNSLVAEAAANQDLVVVRGAEFYKNLPSKTLRTLAYGLSAPERYTHILKTDDDCYVRMQHVLSALQFEWPKPLRNSPRMEMVYIGCMENPNGFMPLRESRSKWYTSPEEMPDDVVPWRVKYLAGWGYVLSRDVAAHVVSQAAAFERNPHTRPAFKPCWWPCTPDTAIIHLDVDAPRLMPILHHKETSGAWDREMVVCSSGAFMVGDYVGWKRWRDSLVDVAAI